MTFPDFFAAGKFASNRTKRLQLNEYPAVSRNYPIKLKAQTHVEIHDANERCKEQNKSVCHSRLRGT